MDTNIRKIASMYQEATATGLPFNGTNEEMLYALKVAFGKEQNTLGRLRQRDNKLKAFLIEMI